MAVELSKLRRGYFAGTEYGFDPPVFGMPLPLLRKKRARKKPPPDVKVSV